MSDRVFWRCSRRECKATAVTVGERLEHVRILHDHERPPSGEFYASSAAAAATTTTTATAITSHTGSPSNYRARRKSNQQSRGIVKQTAKSASEGSVEKNSSSPPKSRSIILSNITEQKQLISDSVSPPQVSTANMVCLKSANHSSRLSRQMVKCIDVKC